MGAVSCLAARIEQGLQRVHPRLRRTVVKKLAPIIAAVIQTQTANTAAWAAVLPLETARADMRLHWIARRLANPLLDRARLLEPVARDRLMAASANCQAP